MEAKETLVTGRWVPADERLPEFNGGAWAGALRSANVTCYGYFDRYFFHTGVEWLELELPEVSQ